MVLGELEILQAETVKISISISRSDSGFIEILVGNVLKNLFYLHMWCS